MARRAKKSVRNQLYLKHLVYRFVRNMRCRAQLHQRGQKRGFRAGGIGKGRKTPKAVSGVPLPSPFPSQFTVHQNRSVRKKQEHDQCPEWRARGEKTSKLSRYDISETHVSRGGKQVVRYVHIDTKIKRFDDNEQS